MVGPQNLKPRCASSFDMAREVAVSAGICAVLRAASPRVDQRVRLATLLHDAPEYVIGDMISPFKAVIGDAYKTVERRLLTAIHRRFGLPPSPPELQQLIKSADHQAAYLEATRLAGHRITVYRKQPDGRWLLARDAHTLSPVEK